RREFPIPWLRLSRHLLRTCWMFCESDGHRREGTASCITSGYLRALSSGRRSRGAGETVGVENTTQPRGQPTTCLVEELCPAHRGQSSWQDPQQGCGGGFRQVGGIATSGEVGMSGDRKSTRLNSSH